MASLLFDDWDQGQVSGLLGLEPGTKVTHSGDPEQAAALGQLYQGIAEARRAERNAEPGRIWSLLNPVGTERLSDQSVTSSEDKPFQPAAFWGGRPVSQAFKDKVDLGSGIAMGFAGSTNLASTPNLLVSTRVPTAKGALNIAGEPLAYSSPDYKIGVDAITADPALAAKVRRIASTEYPGIIARTGDGIRDMIDHGVDNLRWFYETMPKDVRDVARYWYEGANRFLTGKAAENNITANQASGITAALSPKTDWNQNISQFNRILDMRKNLGGVSWDAGVKAHADDVFNAMKPDRQRELRAAFTEASSKPFGEIESPQAMGVWARMFDETYGNKSFNIFHPEGRELGPSMRFDEKRQMYVPNEMAWQSFDNLEKAMSILKDGSDFNISKNLGNAHKVRSFFNDLNVPDPDVQMVRRDITADTHQISGNLLRPLGASHDQVGQGLGNMPPASSITGAKGLYGVHHGAVDEFARELGIPPLQVQSMTWEGIKGLFSPEFKRIATTNKRVGSLDAVDAMWQQYQRRQIDAATLRQNVHDLAGGFAAPPWK